MPAFFFLSIAIGFSSCKKDSLTNTGFTPDQNQLSVITIDTFSVQAVTVNEDSVRANGYLYQMLGSMNEENFGETKAGLVAQMQLSQIDPFLINPADVEIDSINLLINVQRTYGQVEPQDFKVYMLTQPLDSGKEYYSNNFPLVDPFEIGFAQNVTFTAADSIKLGENNFAAGLKMKLYNTFGEYILNNNRNAFVSNFDFINFFKGIYIEPQNNFGQNNGGLYRVNLNTSQSLIRLNYHSKSTNEAYVYDFLFGTDVVKYSTFSSNTQGAAIHNVLNNYSASDNFMYIKSNAGAYIQIELPFMEKFAENKNIIINKAELVLPILNDKNLPYEPHPRIFITGVDDEGNETVLLDQFESQTHYGGTYNETSNDYKIRFTRSFDEKLKQFQNGENPNTTYHIIPGDIISGGAAVNGCQTIVAGKNNPNLNQNFKLIISYTPLNL